MFTLGINTAFRANEFLSIAVGQVQNLSAADAPQIRQTKTQKVRSVPSNVKVIDDIQGWLAKRPACHQCMQNNAQLPVLMDVFGQTTQWQTLQYLGIEEKEIAELY